MRRVIGFTCLLLLTLTLVACGDQTQASQRTPSIIIQTAPPLPTATVQPTKQPTATPTEIVTPTPLAQVQVTRAVNLRIGPGLDYPVIRTLKVKTVVDLVARRDENGERWYQVRAGDDEGWVSGEILTVDERQAAELSISSESFTPPTSTPKPTAVPKPTAAPKPPVAPVVDSVRVGAVCRDGTRSSATGRGACSHHGGVDHWLYR